MNVTGNVELSDCTRKITWYLEDENQGTNAITKLDNAIRLLTQARQYLVSAHKSAAKENKNDLKNCSDKPTVVGS